MPDSDERDDILSRQLLQAVITRRVKNALSLIAKDFEGFMQEPNSPEEVLGAKSLILEMFRIAFMEFYASAGAYITKPDKQG